MANQIALLSLVYSFCLPFCSCSSNWHWVRICKRFETVGLAVSKCEMKESVKEKKAQKRYDEEFKRQAVELMIHSGRTQAQIARELGVSDYSLTLWKRAYLGHRKPAQLAGEQL